MIEAAENADSRYNRHIFAINLARQAHRGQTEHRSLLNGRSNGLHRHKPRAIVGIASFAGRNEDALLGRAIGAIAVLIRERVVNRIIVGNEIALIFASAHTRQRIAIDIVAACWTSRRAGTIGQFIRFAVAIIVFRRSAVLEPGRDFTITGCAPHSRVIAGLHAAHANTLVLRRGISRITRLRVGRFAYAAIHHFIGLPIALFVFRRRAILHLWRDFAVAGRAPCAIGQACLRAAYARPYFFRARAARVASLGLARHANTAR